MSDKLEEVRAAAELACSRAAGMHMHPLERSLLTRLSKAVEIRFGTTSIVNIGIAESYGCCSMLCLRAGSASAYITGIDIEEGDFSKYNFGMRDIVIIGDSKVIGKGWPGMCHLIFVDGDHTEGGVAADIEAWEKHVVVDGIMAFHDYGHYGKPGFEHIVGVKRAVDAFFNGNENWQHIGDVISIRYFKRVK